MRQHTQVRFLAVVWYVIFGTMLVGSWPQTVLAQLSCPVTQISTNTAFNAWSNDDVTKITFTSDSDLTGGNLDGNREVFLFNTNTGTFTQITNTTLPEVFQSLGVISGDGTRIAIASNADLSGDNPDHSNELFLFDTTTSNFTQLTTTDPGSFINDPTISSDGSRIAFSTPSDLGGNNTDGGSEIYLFDVTTNTLSQITSTPDAASGTGQPSISADGSRIAFISIFRPDRRQYRQQLRDLLVRYIYEYVHTGYRHVGVEQC